MSATGHRVGAGAIVARLREIVAGLTLPAGQWGSTEENSLKAFDRVELFDSEQLAEAFRYQLVTEQKSCVIVPLDEQFESVIEKHKLVVRRMLPVALLISDRVLGNRAAALWGDEDTPGAEGLAELALPAVTGLLLPNPKGVVAMPFSLQVMSVKGTEDELPSRVCLALEVHCRGGYLEAALPPSPVW